MPLCQSCSYPVNKYVVGCDACDSRAERAAERTRRAHEDEAREMARFRDRCALSFAVALMHMSAGEGTSGDDYSVDAYTLADAMIAARSPR